MGKYETTLRTISIPKGRMTVDIEMLAVAKNALLQKKAKVIEATGDTDMGQIYDAAVRSIYKSIPTEIGAKSGVYIKETTFAGAQAGILQNALKQVIEDQEYGWEYAYLMLAQLESQGGKFGTRGYLPAKSAREALRKNGVSERFIAVITPMFRKAAKDKLDAGLEVNVKDLIEEIKHLLPCIAAERK